MSQIHVLPNGINTIVNSNSDTMHQCMYCNYWFVPKRRFMQKYCSESCRVLACRHRKKDLFGLSAGNLNDKNKTTNGEIKNDLVLLKDELKTKIERLDSILDNTEARISNKIEHVNSSLENAKEQMRITHSNIQSIKKVQSWHIFISVTIPLIAPTISNTISKLLSKEEPLDNIEGLKKKLEPILQDAPKELKDSIYKAGNQYFQFANWSKPSK